jgi:hypothetical protein
MIDRLGMLAVSGIIMWGASSSIGSELHSAVLGKEIFVLTFNVVAVILLAPRK